MKLKYIQHKFQEDLNTIYSKAEINHFFYSLIEAYYGMKRLQLALDINLEVENTKPILQSLKLLKQHMPIQYILGETEFYDLTFKVNKDVLIPRPETEELVDWVINDLEHQTTALTILDIGTGSGCIAISLAKNLPNAKVYALDVSATALEVAKQNADFNNASVNFFQNDILTISKTKIPQLSHKFDTIVSNPPYVRELEKTLMKPNVLNFEPHLALFVKNSDPLQFYDAIIKFSEHHLKKGGALFFEINEFLGIQVIELFKKYNFTNIALKQDIFKKDRMLKGIKL